MWGPPRRVRPASAVASRVARGPEGSRTPGAGDAEGEVFGDYLDEGFELRMPPDYPEGELVFRGRDGLLRLGSDRLDEP